MTSLLAPNPQTLFTEEVHHALDFIIRQFGEPAIDLAKRIMSNITATFQPHFPASLSVTMVCMDTIKSPWM